MNRLTREHWKAMAWIFVALMLIASLVVYSQYEPAGSEGTDITATLSVPFADGMGVHSRTVAGSLIQKARFHPQEKGMHLRLQTDAGWYSLGVTDDAWDRNQPVTVTFTYANHVVRRKKFSHMVNSLPHSLLDIRLPGVTRRGNPLLDGDVESIELTMKSGSAKVTVFRSDQNLAASNGFGADDRTVIEVEFSP